MHFISNFFLLRTIHSCSYYFQTPDTFESISLVEYKALIGGNDQVHKQLPKLLSFKFKVPSGFHNSFTMTVENKDYDNSGKEIDFCTIAIGKTKF